jgi:hypothetical protein
MPQKPFEIPQRLRRLAEENVEQARQLYLQFVDRLRKPWPFRPRLRHRNSIKFASGPANSRKRTLMPPSLAKEVSQAKDLQELLSLTARRARAKIACGLRGLVATDRTV